MGEVGFKMVCVCVMVGVERLGLTLFIEDLIQDNPKVTLKLILFNLNFTIASKMET